MLHHATLVVGALNLKERLSKSSIHVMGVSLDYTYLSMFLFAHINRYNRSLSVGSFLVGASGINIT